MSEFLPEAVRRGLEDARRAALRRSAKLCVHVGDEVYRINKMWDTGFSLDAKDAPHLRGQVDIYDGMRHVSRCLIVASTEESGEMLFEFKWNTPVSDRPALDYVQEREAPAGLLGFIR